MYPGQVFEHVIFGFFFNVFSLELCLFLFFISGVMFLVRIFYEIIFIDIKKTCYCAFILFFIIVSWCSANRNGLCTNC